MKKFLLIVLLLVVIAMVAVPLFAGDVLRTATGSVSRSLCSAAFLSQVDPDQVYREEQLPRLHALDWVLRYAIDRDHRETRTTTFGAFAARAVYRDGIGCLLIHGADPVPEATGAPRAQLPDEQPLVVTSNPRLQKALDDAFTEPDSDNRRYAKAMVVLHDGQLIAERYAAGYGPQTPIWAHSMTKSLTSALIGILVRDGKIRVEQPVGFWNAPNDPRRGVTVDQLLRMTAGFPFDDTDDIINPLTRMLFLEKDPATYAATVDIEHPPGTHWAYSNVGFELLARMIHEQVGGRCVDVIRFAREQLLDPVGMHHTMLDCDAQGVPVGAAVSYGSARDWARFGQLYLDDGVVNGRRILPEGWVAYSRSRTLDTGYGAGFWTNLGHGEVPVWHAPWGMPSLPKDMFYARGALGQYVVVIPSERLVVARMGFGYGGVETAIAAIIQALHAGESAAATSPTDAH